MRSKGGGRLILSWTCCSLLMHLHRIVEPRVLSDVLVLLTACLSSVCCAIWPAGSAVRLSVSVSFPFFFSTPWVFCWMSDLPVFISCYGTSKKTVVDEFSCSFRSWRSCARLYKNRSAVHGCTRTTQLCFPGIKKKLLIFNENLHTDYHSTDI